MHGKKLILEIVTKPDYAVIDAAPAGTFMDGKIPTNDTAAILDSSSTSVAYTASPKLPANTVTYKINEGGVLRTVGTYYRFPGAQVNVLPKPTDTHTYTYSEWATSDAAISSGMGHLTCFTGSETIPAIDAIEELQVAGKKRMAVRDLLLGYQMQDAKFKM